MVDETPKKYTTSDYSILNEHFSQALAREKEIVRAKRSQTFWQNAKSVSLLLFFLGILAILIGKAIYFAKQERIVEVEKIVEIEKVVNQRESFTPEESVITVNGDKVPIKKNVIHFSKVSVSLNNQSYNVATRHQYDDPRQEEPSNQSCYVTLDESTQFSFEVSYLNNEGQIIMYPYEPQSEAARKMNFRESDVNYFQQFCRYV